MDDILKCIRILINNQGSSEYNVASNHLMEQSCNSDVIISLCDFLFKDDLGDSQLNNYISLAILYGIKYNLCSSAHDIEPMKCVGNKILELINKRYDEANSSYFGYLISGIAMITYVYLDDFFNYIVDNFPTNIVLMFILKLFDESQALPYTNKVNLSDILILKFDRILEIFNQSGSVSCAVHFFYNLIALTYNEDLSFLVNYLDILKQALVKVNERSYYDFWNLLVKCLSMDQPQNCEVVQRLLVLVITEFNNFLFDVNYYQLIMGTWSAIFFPELLIDPMVKFLVNFLFPQFMKQAQTILNNHFDDVYLDYISLIPSLFACDTSTSEDVYMLKECFFQFFIFVCGKTKVFSEMLVDAIEILADNCPELASDFFLKEPTASNIDFFFLLATNKKFNEVHKDIFNFFICLDQKPSSAMFFLDAVSFEEVVSDPENQLACLYEFVYFNNETYFTQFCLITKKLVKSFPRYMVVFMPYMERAIPENFFVNIKTFEVFTSYYYLTVQKEDYSICYDFLLGRLKVFYTVTSENPCYLPDYIKLLLKLIENTPASNLNSGFPSFVGMIIDDVLNVHVTSEKDVNIVADFLHKAYKISWVNLSVLSSWYQKYSTFPLKINVNKVVKDLLECRIDPNLVSIIKRSLEDEVQVLRAVSLMKKIAKIDPNTAIQLFFDDNLLNLVMNQNDLVFKKILKICEIVSRGTWLDILEKIVDISVIRIPTLKQIKKMCISIFAQLAYNMISHKSDSSVRNLIPGGNLQVFDLRTIEHTLLGVLSGEVTLST